MDCVAEHFFVVEAPKQDCFSAMMEEVAYVTETDTLQHGVLETYVLGIVCIAITVFVLGKRRNAELAAKV